MVVICIIILTVLAIMVVLPLFEDSRECNKVYACPNCGHRFRKSRLWCNLNAENLRRGQEAFYMKCPKCGAKDHCRISLNQEL